MIEIELFQVTKDEHDTSVAHDPFWLAKEIERVDGLGWIQPSVSEMKKFLDESGYRYKFVQRQQRKLLVVPAPGMQMRPVLDITVSIQFPDDTEGLYFKMWKS